MITLQILGKPGLQAHKQQAKLSTATSSSSPPYRMKILYWIEMEEVEATVKDEEWKE